MKRMTVVLLFGVLAVACGGNKNGGDGTSDGTEGVDVPEGVDTPIDQPPVEGTDQPPQDLPDVLYEPELCGEADFNIARIIPDILIVLDRSNSMALPTDSPLWNVIRQAIITVTRAMDDAIWFGLMSFPNSLDPSACEGSMNTCAAPASVLVPIAADNATAIETALMSLTTCGGTPTAVTLQSASDYLVTLTDDHPSFIILATDGAPNCNESLDGSTCTCTSTAGCSGTSGQHLNCLDDTRTYGALDILCTAGSHTYILGMGGATSWTEVLQGMATHGCTDTPYAVNDPDAIQAALDEIAGAVASCQFEMNCADIPDGNKVNFYFTVGTEKNVVPRDTGHADGWDWVDPCDSTSDPSGMIEFFGPACDSILSREVDEVSATFGCPTIII
jgi:hypothetical protein